MDRAVFINYRGEDSHSYGALLYTELARHFGADHVFLDAESIPAGTDFVRELLGRVRSARVLLAVIGPRWLTATDPTGRRRIDDPADWIRRELAEAFDAGVPVIPVLTDQAELPRSAELPADIAALSRCQGRPLRRREPTADLARIVTDLTCLDHTLAVPKIVPKISSISVVHRLRGTLAAAITRSPGRRAIPTNRSSELDTAPGTVTGSDSVPEPRTAGDLPRIPSSFIGRLRELHEVAAAMADVRLLTLTGPGGAGKTRLAVAVADGLSSEQDVRFVDLAPIAESGLVVQALSATLQLPDSSEGPLIDTIVRALRHHKMIIVLDNCEHVIDGVAPMLEVLLARCPQVRFLATSREALRVAGEVVWPVPPLSMPFESASDVSEATRSDAVMLFVTRAREVRPTFALDDRNVGPVTTICKQLDGLALAIEIVAVRVRLMEVHELAGHIGEHLTWGTYPDRLAPARRRTLHATMEWSYSLLGPQQQDLLRRLGVFAGSFSLAAAAACAGNGQSEPEVLEALGGLVDSSLVTTTATATGETRYRLLATIRAYARELLTSTMEFADIEQRHADFYLAQAEAAAPRFTSDQRDHTLIRIELDYPNIHAALARLTVAPDGGPAALRLAGALFWYWNSRGYLREGRGWLHVVLERSSVESSAARATALYGAGGLDFLMGELDTADERLRESVRIWTELGQQRQLAFALVILAMVGLYRGHLEPARENAETAVHIFRELGDQWGLALALNDLGNVTMGLNEHEAGSALYEQSLLLWEALDDLWGLALTLSNLGVSACQRGDYRRARAALDRALRIQIGNRDLYGHAWTLMALADVACAQGDTEHAESLYRESLSMHMILGRRQLVCDCLVGLAKVAGLHSQPRAAALLFGAAEAQREHLGVRAPIPQRRQFEPDVDAARGDLDPTEFETIQRTGRTMNPEQALAAVDHEMRGGRV